MKLQPLALVLLIGGLLGMGGCNTLFNIDRYFLTDRYIVVIDQTLSTRELRSHDAIHQFLKALVARPNLDIEIYGMMPDRLYLTSVEQALNQDFGEREDGTYTGGDLQQVINLFDSEEESKVLIITDGENNFGNIPTTLPTFLYPEKFYLIGIRDELWQGYTKLGVHAITLSGTEQLTRQLVFEGRLRDEKGGKPCLE